MSEFNHHKSLRELSDEDALKRAKSDYEAAKSKKQDAITRANRYINIYKALNAPEDVIDESSGKMAEDESIYSDTYMPVGAAIVDSGVKKAFNHLFGSDEYFQIGVQDFDDEPFSYPITAHLMKRHRQMKFKYLVYRALQQACIYDYAITFTRWLLRPGYVNVRKEEVSYKQLGPLKVPFQRVKMVSEWRPDVIDRSDVQLMNFLRCYHDWDAQNGFEDSRFFCDDRDEMLEDLVQQAKTKDRPWGKYQNIDKLLQKYKDESDSDATDVENDKDNTVAKTRKPKVIRYWTPDHILEYSRDIIIRRTNVAGWALQNWKIFELPNKFEGMGLLQRLERNQYDVNASMNSRRDFQNLVVNPFGVIHSDLVPAEGGPEVYPGKMFVSDGGDDMRKKMYIYQPGVNINQDSLTDVDAQIGMMEKISKTSENSLQQAVGGRTTAKEISVIEGSQIGDTAMLTIKLEETCLQPIYLNQFLLEQINLTREERFKHYGQHGDAMMRIRPEDYAWGAQPEFYAMGTTDLMSKAIGTQQFMAAIQMGFEIGPELLDKEPILVELFRRLVPKNYTHFIKDPRVPMHNVPAEIENQMIARGQKVEVSPANDAREHLPSHEGVKNTVDYQLWPDNMKLALDAHIQQHQQSGIPSQGVPPIQDSSDPFRGQREGATI